MFVIKRGDRFMKRSYDSDNGMWTYYEHQAKTWKTRKGAQTFYDRFISIWRISGCGTAEIVEVQND
jgi:hypothetical protein